MELIPAIDLLEGAAVRLMRGDYREVTVYDTDAVDAAGRWGAAGASLIHVVDLDAARGLPRDLGTIRRLGRTGTAIQVGGGVRTAKDAFDTISAGALRVVVGSVLLTRSEDARSIVEAVGADRVVAAIDVRGGRARGSGWLDDGVPVADAVDRVVELGIGSALVTGIERDGTMDGPDTAVLAGVRGRAEELRLIASGGVGSEDDLVSLSTSPVGIEAAIVGRALYEGRIDLSHALSRLRSADDTGH